MSTAPARFALLTPLRRAGAAYLALLRDIRDRRRDGRCIVCDAPAQPGDGLCAAHRWDERSAP